MWGGWEIMKRGDGRKKRRWDSCIVPDAVFAPGGCFAYLLGGDTGCLVITSRSERLQMVTDGYRVIYCFGDGRRNTPGLEKIKINSEAISSPRVLAGIKPARNRRDFSGRRGRR